MGGVVIGALLEPLIGWIGPLLALIAGGAGLWFAGRRSKSKDVKVDRAEANENAAKKAKDTRHEIEISDDQHLIDILSGRVPPR